MSDLKKYIAKLADGESLSQNESFATFQILMNGEATSGGATSGGATDAQIGGILMALRVKGETVDEIIGATMAMQQKMLPVENVVDAIDIVGTGGDGSGSLNISTAAAFVVAGCGVRVAKHGNRALSSKSGAGDVLEKLGVNINCQPKKISKCINEVGLGFMFAPNHHSAVKHVGKARVELGTRTLFNLLGPLCNPAGVKNYMLGVFSPQWVEPLAQVLKQLGSESAFVVHGESAAGKNGMDEVSISGKTQVAKLKDGKITTFTIEPKDAGLPMHDIEKIKGGDAQTNATALKNLLAGEKKAYRDIVLINSAAALMVAGRAENLKHGVELAKNSIDEGKAQAVLEKLVKLSNE